jgi:hypothetical protein
VSVVHVKILNVNVLKNVNVILNSHAKEYKKQATILIIKKFMMYCLINTDEDKVLNKGFRYIEGHMKIYEQTKKGLSYAYHKRKVAANGIDTTPLDI